MTKAKVKSKLLADDKLTDYKYTGCGQRKACKRVRKTIRRSLKRKENLDVAKNNDAC